MICFRKAYPVRPRSQSGVTTLEFVIWGVLAAVGLILLVNVLLGRQAEAQTSRAKTLIGTDIAGVLASIYQARGGTYATLTADAAGALQITSRGISPTMPWGVDTWAISTAGTNSSVSLTFHTDSTARPADVASDLAQGLAGRAAMVQSATSTATTLTVTFGIP